MFIRWTNLLFFPIIIFLFISIPVSAIGDFTVELYEHNKEVIFLEGQTSQTIYIDGVVNYTGVSISGDTIELSSESDIGESNISPTKVIFHTTGSQEFTAELQVSNIYENGTTGSLTVSGTYQQGGTITIKGTDASILIINSSYMDNDDGNSNNSKNHQKNEDQLDMGSILIVSTTIVIIAIIIFITYRKILK